VVQEAGADGSDVPGRCSFQCPQGRSPFEDPLATRRGDPGIAVDPFNGSSREANRLPLV
jgi:hypothetical protein